VPSPSACAEKELYETHSLNCVLSSALEVMSWYFAVPAIESASAIVQKCRPKSASDRTATSKHGGRAQRSAHADTHTR
jgi:hypothetical protein